jgi:hypothetical protein
MFNDILGEEKVYTEPEKRIPDNPTSFKEIWAENQRLINKMNESEEEELEYEDLQLDGIDV